MKKEIKIAIEEYQCSGCAAGGNISCFKENLISGGVGCGKHTAGTYVSQIGKVFLGLPNGFNRIGNTELERPQIFETFHSSKWKYDKYNIPVWKYLNVHNHTIVRGVMPRKNESFIHIFLEDCMDKIDCIEITQADVNYMD